VLDKLREAPGVADVQATLEEYVRVTLPGVSDPVIGQLIGLDARHPPRMNRLTLSSGRPLDGTDLRADGELEALVSEAFANARGLSAGSRVTALVNGRQRTLRIVGTALSPEFIFAGLWGMPDMRNFGIFWVDHEALAAACDMRGNGLKPGDEVIVYPNATVRDGARVRRRTV
jgi:putative ABC transport system permease protein